MTQQLPYGFQAINGRKLKGCGNLGEERGRGGGGGNLGGVSGQPPPPPPPTIVGATHDKVCDFGTLHLKLGINIQIYLF